MENGQIEETTRQDAEQNPNPYPVSLDGVHVERHLYYTGKMFPMNALVKVAGREGIYRVVSKPYIPRGYNYPHFDVETPGERFRANVFSATRIYLC